MIRATLAMPLGRFEMRLQEGSARFLGGKLRSFRVSRKEGATRLLEACFASYQEGAACLQACFASRQEGAAFLEANFASPQEGAAFPER